MEASNGSAGAAASSELALRFANLFEELSDVAVLRLRDEFDSNCRFRADGSAVDLRTLVYRVLSNVDRHRVLVRIQTAAATVGASAISASLCAEGSPKWISGCDAGGQEAGLTVISDVDDTLLPAHDSFGIGGQDMSWSKDGRLYPGVAKLHKELRKGDPPHAYSVMLTARPPSFCSTLPAKLARIAASAGSSTRLSILPGADVPKAVFNLAGILGGTYDELGHEKLQRIKEYTALFPEQVGRNVFIGDDGQADFMVAKEVLSMTDMSSGAPLFAFVAIKAVQTSDDFLIPREEQKALTERLREAYPPVSFAQRLPRHRFFYFTTYEDFAKQLSTACDFGDGVTYPGWLTHEQCSTILRAAERDRAFGLLGSAVRDRKLLEVTRSPPRFTY
jgi:hypothetical protein